MHLGFRPKPGLFPQPLKPPMPPIFPPAVAAGLKPATRIQSERLPGTCCPGMLPTPGHRFGRVRSEGLDALGEHCMDPVMDPSRGGYPTAISLLLGSPERACGGAISLLLGILERCSVVFSSGEKTPLNIEASQTAYRKIALVAEAGGDRDLVTALGPAAAQNGCASLAGHAGEKAVNFATAATVGLKGALGHRVCPVSNLRY